VIHSLAQSGASVCRERRRSAYKQDSLSYQQLALRLRSTQRDGLAMTDTIKDCLCPWIPINPSTLPSRSGRCSGPPFPVAGMDLENSGMIFPSLRIRKRGSECPRKSI
jgi:hypothetical protein